MVYIVQIVMGDLSNGLLSRFIRVIEMANKYGLGLASGSFSGRTLIININAPDKETAFEASNYGLPHRDRSGRREETIAYWRSEPKHDATKTLGEVLGELYKEVQES